MIKQKLNKKFKQLISSDKQLDKYQKNNYQYTKQVMQNNNIIEFLQQKDYKILDHKQETFRSNYYYEFNGLNAFSQPVLIKISNPNTQSYQLVKNECQILNKMKNFNSTIQLFDCFDLDELKTFILITESINQTFYDYIQNMYSSSLIEPDFGEVVNIFQSLLFSLFEIHSKGFYHLNINPHSIVFDQSGNLKFRNFLNFNELNYFETSKMIKDPYYSFFNSPEADQIIPKTLNIYSYQSLDVFGLGVLVLLLFGFQINEQTINLINRQSYNSLEKMGDPKFYNLFQFVKSYMLQPKQEQRFSVYQLQRFLFKCYEKVIVKSQFIERIQKTIQIYQQNNLQADEYYLLLHTSQILYNAQILIEQEVETIFNQIYQDDSDKMQNSYSLMYEIGIFYYESDNVQKCLDLFKQTLLIRQNLFGENHQLVSESYNSVGNSNYYLDNFQEALQFYEKSCNLRKELYGENHISVSECFTNIADCYRWLNNVEMSIQFNQLAIDIQNKTYQGSHFSKIFSLICMGQIARWKNNHQKSLEYHLQVLKMREDIYSSNHYAIPLSYRTIGICYKYLKDYEKSFEYHKKALLMKQEIYKGNHQYVANSFFDLADCYLGIQDYDNEFLYRLKHLQMMFNIKKEKIRAFHTNQILFNLDKITDLYKRVKYSLTILKVLKTNLNGNNNFMKQILNLISEQYKLLDEEESSEEYQNISIKMSKHFS
ncbi:tetratricopeptide repeat protein (macronuclear) [Tetrahymena thermophila SB210]|uniref:Tetratricopeptide repeat protein n=1 Tax=Tetrahymena thermophila (strain SB210) TaxID=312017 RepID=Q22R75_TETTS|nr:tetratricopeptide repeat protein [Tetrahymena thermophila SB210]EAR88247.2 tetratricopeptide repeat protein [Tetrahymena thermophila SB210]|eukprot:XP_001008492.2 tetratricopeptide repeat protein [Tetrahymena thermophila SB210]